MNDTGLSNISSDSIFKILSTPPVLNDGTIFTVLMSAVDRSHSIYILDGLGNSLETNFFTILILIRIGSSILHTNPMDRFM